MQMQIMSRIPQETDGIINLLQQHRIDPIDLLKEQIEDEEAKVIRDVLTGKELSSIKCGKKLEKYLKKNIYRYFVDGEYLMAHYNERNTVFWRRTLLGEQKINSRPSMLAK